MTRPDSLFEAASYDLNKFIERRVTERRAVQRDALDRRQQPSLQNSNQENLSTQQDRPADKSSLSH